MFADPEYDAFIDSREGFDVDEYARYAYENGDDDANDADEHDGQPDEYTEWQDLYGGDDWDHGQYDEPW